MAELGPKILLISSEFPPNVGGIGNHAYNLAKSLSKEGYRVTVIADIIDVAETELAAFEALQSFRINWIKRKGFVLQTYLQRIFKTLQLSDKTDQIICSGKFSLWLAILIRFFHPGKDLVAVVHGSELDLKSSLPKKVTSFSLKRFNKIVSVSNYTARFLPATLSARIKRFVIHNGINCEEFEATTSVKLPGEPALITVGSVTERKGQENVINALPVLLATYPNAAYHVVGKPVIKAALEKRAKQLQVNSRVRFYGAVDRKELLEKLSGADIKMMLSNHTADGDFEGFGIAVLEANFYGVPVIGSKNSGIADAIEDNETGILVNPQNPAEILNAVNSILNNYSYFSLNAKAWAIQHDWKNIVKEYVVALKA